jgi:hypothetical protein
MKQNSTVARNAAPTITQSSTLTVQRQCACGGHSSGVECGSCKERKRKLQRSGTYERQETGGAGRGEELLQSGTMRERLRGGGQPLEKELRGEMESRYAHDFSKVRVHTSAGAGESARAFGAHAWTLGSDVVFAHGAYDTTSAKGQRLIAHELAHVVQQSGAAASEPQAELEVSAPGDAAEREAESAADRVMDGGAVSVRQTADGETVHRLSDVAGDGTSRGR